MTTDRPAQDESEGLGARFWLGLLAVTIAMVLGLFAAVFLFGLAWYEWGFVGAAILLIAVASGVKYLQDRRTQRRWSS